MAQISLNFNGTALDKVDVNRDIFSPISTRR
jgi:hypothetical protein